MAGPLSSSSMRSHNKGQALALDGEVPAQVEQGPLAHLAVLALALDEAGERRAEPSLAVPVLVARTNMDGTVGPRGSTARAQSKKMALQRPFRHHPGPDAHVKRL